MKLTIDGTPEEIKKMLNTICGSGEHEGKTLDIKKIGTRDPYI